MSLSSDTGCLPQMNRLGHRCRWQTEHKKMRQDKLRMILPLWPPLSM